MQKVAVIGAGVAGLAAAMELVRAGRQVVIFDKSRGISGRAATRRRDGLHFDHGANFFRTDDPVMQQLVHEALPTAELAAIPGQVWTFDCAGVLSPGDAKQNARPKYTYRPGISTLGKLMAQASGAEIRREHTVARVDRKDGCWTVGGVNGEDWGRFETVLLTAPSPQAAQILRASSFDETLRETLVQALEAARYHAQFSFILGYHRRVSRPQPFHALVNTDGGHALAWLSFEDDKPGHVPEDQSVVVAQMAPNWSHERLEAPRETVAREAIAEVRALLPSLPEEPDWWDAQRWMLAHPKEAADTAQLSSGAAPGLYFAGDGLAGKGRVHLAVRSGIEAARRMLAEAKPSS